MKFRRDQDPGKNGNLLLRGAVAGSIALAALAGCSMTEAAPRESGSITKTVEVEDAAAQAEKQRVEEAAAYALSPERVERMDAALQEYGGKVVELAGSKKMGYFDAYNPQAESWRSRGVDSGWVWLQHNPQYGGSNDQIMATVWQNPDGTFDLGKGVLSVSVIKRDGETITDEFGIEAPGWFDVSSQGADPVAVRDGDNYHGTGRLDSSPKVSYLDSIDTNQTATNMQQGDERTLAALNEYFADK